MREKIPGFLLGVVIGGGIVFLATRPDSSEVESWSGSTPSLRSDSAAERRLSSSIGARQDEVLWRQRLAVATSNQTKRLSAERPTLGNQPKIPEWMTALTVRDDQSQELAAMAGEGFADGSGDSRISGSVLDRWIRANGSPELQVEWRNLLKERQLDVVERRANVLLSDLQGEMSLDADTKDALYSEMVRRAEDEYVSLGAGTLPGEETLERWSHDYFSALEPHLTAAQRETLTDWLGGRMAEFWMAESGMMPESP